MLRVRAVLGGRFFRAQFHVDHFGCFRHGLSFLTAEITEIAENLPQRGAKHTKDKGGWRIENEG
jgi:hypothetical protein